MPCLLWLPSGFETERFGHLESVAAKNTERIADVWNMPVLPLPRWLRHLSGDNASILGKSKGVRNEKWISTESENLIFR
jgi:hypothetical protein